jgi:hypothetical protein
VSRFKGAVHYLTPAIAAIALMMEAESKILGRQ